MMRPWEETWHVGLVGSVRRVVDRDDVGTMTEAVLSYGRDEDVKLAAAAPAMARALCFAEQSEDERAGNGLFGSIGAHCACCLANWGCESVVGGPSPDFGIEHETGCAIDAALTAAGLAPADREAVRKAGK